MALSVVFFFASAGVSAAYLTVSEIFPMETRALCIAVFYAVGTGHRRHHGSAAVPAADQDRQLRPGQLALLLGAVMMIVGGLAELIFGVKAEGQTLENIAKPLTAEDTPGPATGGPQPAPA